MIRFEIGDHVQFRGDLESQHYRLLYGFENTPLVIRRFNSLNRGLVYFEGKNTSCCDVAFLEPGGGPW